MRKSRKKANKQLGISFDKARNILNRNILFDLVKKLKLDFCARCKHQIKIVDDLTIDHLKPWLDSTAPVKLFFSLNNIGFSHAKCNIARPKRKIGPKNTRWCGNCRRFLDQLNFCKNKYTWHGYNWTCKKCSSKRQKIYRLRKIRGKNRTNKKIA
jgi:hypothetical protein